MELLKQLYAIHAHSGQEKGIRKFIKRYITDNIPAADICCDKLGNMYVTKGISETYPCVVAHLDQVQRIHSKDFRAIETQDIIFGYSSSNRRQEGLGADDKNGIWVALKCLMKNKALKVAFFVGEEVGCVGSSAADLSFFENCRFVIEPDRRGYNDLITEISWTSLCSEKFLSDTQFKQFAYKQADGLMTDIEVLRERGLAISCINLSCGYYEPHTDCEFTVKRDLLNCLDFVQHIIERCTDVYAYEPQEFSRGYYCGDDSFMEDELFEMMMEHPDYTADDMWDAYQTNFPGFSREDFIAMYEECAFAYDIDIPKPKSKKKSSTKKENSTKEYIYFTKKQSPKDARQINF
jgi:hypothetical protein